MIRSKIKLSIAQKFTVLTCLSIISTSLVTAAFVIWVEINNSYKDATDEGASLALIVADNLEYGVYTENQESLQSVLKSLDKNREIIYARIISHDMKVLSERIQKPSILIPQIDHDERTWSSDKNSGKATRNFGGYIDIVAPVMSAGDSAQDLFFLEGKERRDKKLIGYLQIGLTMDEVNKKIHDFMVSTILFTILFILIGVGFTMLLTRKITSPLNQLNLASQDIASGNLDHIIDIRTGDEISDLAASFNHMLHNLKDYRCQVEARTQELSKANIELTEEIRVRRETEISLAATKLRLEHLLSNTPAVIYSMKAYRDFEFAFISKNVKSLLGYDDSEFLEDPQKWVVCVHQNDLWQYLNDRDRLFDAECNVMEYRFRRRDGTYIWLHDEIRVIRDTEGIPQEVVGYFIDVTSQKELEEKLVSDALHDPLTGLPNRALFLDRLENALTHSRQTLNYMFCVLFLDLDRFKKVNDSLGHAVGDSLLISVSQRLKHCIHKKDTVARLGGDEFAIILTNIKSVESAEIISARIHKELLSPFTIEGHEIYLSVSIGIAMNDIDYSHSEQFLRDADTAMYHAKGKGGGCHVLFDRPMHERALHLMRLETDLQHALERNELFLDYQPIIISKTGRVKGFEALLRWKHPERGIISPLEFIPLAEETGLIIPIGNWVLYEACQQMSMWQKDSGYDFPLTISVNISSRQFTPQLIQYTNKVLRETGLDPTSLILEITESVIMEDPENTAKLLMKFKEMNVRLQIDDFGTGYSSLNYLHHFPVDALKVDKSFVQSMHDNEDKLEIVKLIITLAHNLYMGVIAEGVETVEQQTLLKTLNCEYMQGFLFSKPIDAREIDTLLRQSDRLI